MEVQVLLATPIYLLINMKNRLFLCFCLFILSSCSAFNEASKPYKVVEEEKPILQSYDFFALGKRGTSLKELVYTIDDTSTYLFEFKDVQDLTYCAYLPNDLITNEVDQRYLNNQFYKDCIDGKNVYKHLDDALWVSYNNKNDLLKQIKHQGKQYTLDLVLAVKEISYYYDYSNQKAVDKTVNVLIRNIYEEDNEKLKIKQLEDACLRIGQYYSECYLLNLQGKHFGFGKLDDDLISINNAINEYELFDIVNKNEVEYVMYPYENNVSDEMVKDIAGKYYEDLKDHYVLESGKLSFELAAIMGLKQ